MQLCLHTVSLGPQHAPICRAGSASWQVCVYSSRHLGAIVLIPLRCSKLAALVYLYSDLRPLARQHQLGEAYFENDAYGAAVVSEDAAAEQKGVAPGWLEMGEEVGPRMFSHCTAVASTARAPLANQPTYTHSSQCRLPVPRRCPSLPCLQLCNFAGIEAARHDGLRGLASDLLRLKVGCYRATKGPREAAARVVAYNACGVSGLTSAGLTPAAPQDKWAARCPVSGPSGPHVPVGLPT